MENEKTFKPEDEKIFKDIWDSLTDEQKKKAKTCKNEDELVGVLNEGSFELTDENLDSVAGGAYMTEGVDKEGRKCYHIHLKDGYLIETQYDRNHAVCITDFYTFLEERGEI